MNKMALSLLAAGGLALGASQPVLALDGAQLYQTKTNIFGFLTILPPCDILPNAEVLLPHGCPVAPLMDAVPEQARDGVRMRRYEAS